MKQACSWRVFDDAPALAAHASAFILRSAREAIAKQRVFRIVLAGGGTPRDVYAWLAVSDADWPCWQVYFGDERCLPRGEAQRNDTMAQQVWLGLVTIPKNNVHAIPAELGPELAATRYAQTLTDVGDFDLVLLGLGEDGHTAGLFPGRSPGERKGDPDVWPVRNAPKPPAERVTLSAARLSRSRQALFLVTGTAKCDAVAAWQAGRDIPARHITPSEGVVVLLDQEAAGSRG